MCNSSSNSFMAPYSDQETEAPSGTHTSSHWGTAGGAQFWVPLEASAPAPLWLHLIPSHCLWSPWDQGRDVLLSSSLPTSRPHSTTQHSRIPSVLLRSVQNSSLGPSFWSAPPSPRGSHRVLLAGVGNKYWMCTQNVHTCMHEIIHSERQNQHDEKKEMGWSLRILCANAPHRHDLKSKVSNPELPGCYEDMYLSE